MDSIIEAVTFFCPVFITGGTEAIHQAAHLFNKAGLQTQIAYHGAGWTCMREKDEIRCIGASQDNACLTAFASYEPRIAERVPLRSDHLVVVPEVAALDQEAFRPARRAIWWLSVDNAFQHIPALHDPSVRARLFADCEVVHLFQSEYARRFLIENQATHIHRLTDETKFDYLIHDGSRAARSPRVLFNPKKGLDLARAFFASHPEFGSYGLDGMQAEALARAYAENQIYIDFGSLPGKDRMPREAAAAGCIVFVQARGAGRELGDFPLNDFYKFTTDDVGSGRLAERVRAVLADPAPHQELQRHFRDAIFGEGASFRSDVANLIALLRRPVAHPNKAVPPTETLSHSVAPAAQPSAQALSGFWSEHADRHCIWIVSPTGYSHSHAFDDVAEALSAAFAARGGSAPIARHPSEWAGRVPIVLGAHLLSESLASILPKDSILYNFEQADRASSWMNALYLGLLRRHAVLDYSARNLDRLRAMGVAHARLLPVGHAPALERSASAGERDIDVLFYGSVNERRAAVLQSLQNRGIRTMSLFDVYGAERDAAIARAKIVLNMHYYDAAIFESARVVPLLASGACVVTEGDGGDPDLAPFLGGLAVCGLGEIVDLCVLLLGEDAVRAELARRGRELARAFRQQDLLGALFAPDRAAA